MDYKKVGVVSSVVLAYSGFTASIPVQATTVSTDSFALQDEHQKPVDLTIKQVRSESDPSSKEEISSDTTDEVTQTSESTQLDISGSESSSNATSESIQNSAIESSTNDFPDSTDTTTKPVESEQTSTSTTSVNQTDSRKKAAIAKEITKESTGNSEENVEEFPTTIYYTPNFSTQRFINQIAEQATKIGEDHDLYASIMIAQAILESGSGNSGLASPPNYNLFGIKGSYRGQTVRFMTSEDDGTGSLYKINTNFRKYTSYKESLEDYANLLSRNVYSGARKSSTSSYQEATSFLTGHYATDTSYGAKLNGLIQAYDLEQYDNPIEELPELTERDQTSKPIVKEAKVNEEVPESTKVVNSGVIVHEVQPGESLKKISEQYEIPTATIIEQNQLTRLVLMVGQVLEIETDIRPREIDQTTIESEGRFQQDSLLNKKITEVIPESVFKTNDLRYKITATSALPTDSYQVQRGDSLLKISKKVGLSVQSLREWNRLEGYLLREGQILRITPTLNV